MTENNEHEGEYWHFYCSYDKQYSEEMEQMLHDFNEYVLDNTSWSIDDEFGLTEKYVENIINHCNDTGRYMPEHNYGKHISFQGLFKFLKCRICMTKLKKDEENCWYKGEYYFECECSDNDADITTFSFYDEDYGYISIDDGSDEEK